MGSFFSNLFGTDPVERYRARIPAITEAGKELTALSDAALLARSHELRITVATQEGTEEALNNALEKAFALVRETSTRTLKQRHYDVQLIGGMALYEGSVTEMLTGEGKTLVATLPAYLRALAGDGVHVVTVNDYLARRDTVWMGQVYHALGLTVACIVHDAAYRYDPSFAGTADAERDATGSFRVIEQFLRPISRRDAYAADITYGTNHEFGFDYLRDNLTLQTTERVQRPHSYALIDEVDSILIDEARTPLIIAAPDRASSDAYKAFAHIAKRLDAATDYVVDEKLRTVHITDAGIEKTEKLLGITNIFSPEHSRLVHFLNESLKAYTLFRRDKQYVVQSGEIYIVDEFTGRILHGRRYSGGLHQAIEAKEGVLVREENRTYAQVTIQNYFRLYQKLAGMTGTAQTSAEEFHTVYGLTVMSIPPNRSTGRNDMPDLIFKTKEEKYRAIVADVEKRHQQGQPILIGTASIEHNEIIADQLTRANVPHEVLNAKNNEREGAIIAQAGRRGAVTVATNMAGRGVDIILGGNPPDAAEADVVRTLGGLHVIGTERHEARRIDNQLRGRSGRQGDPGSTQFYLSLEDDLVRIFGGDRIKSLMERVQFPDDTPIESRMVSRAVSQAQQRVEGSNFDIRKHLLEFDDILNKQRTALYRKRWQYLEAGGASTVLSLVKESLTQHVTLLDRSVHTHAFPDANADAHAEELRRAAEARKKIEAVPEMIEPERTRALSEHAVRILDTLWIDHLENLEALRDSVNIRAYGQHEPLVEYRREAHGLFQQLNRAFDELLFTSVFELLAVPLTTFTAQPVVTQDTSPSHSVGRNDPCWCGSGKKYKRCGDLNTEEHQKFMSKK